MMGACRASAGCSVMARLLLAGTRPLASEPERAWVAASLLGRLAWVAARLQVPQDLFWMARRPLPELPC